jgi:hypothetical protein
MSVSGSANGGSPGARRGSPRAAWLYFLRRGKWPEAARRSPPADTTSPPPGDAVKQARHRTARRPPTRPRARQGRRQGTTGGPLCYSPVSQANSRRRVGPGQALLRQAGQGERPTVPHSEVEWLLMPGARGLPLVEPRCRDEAAPRLEGPAEGRLLRDRLRTGVDERVADLRVFGPTRDEPPAKQDEGAPAVVGQAGASSRSSSSKSPCRVAGCGARRRACGTAPGHPAGARSRHRHLRRDDALRRGTGGLSNRAGTEKGPRPPVTGKEKRT